MFELTTFMGVGLYPLAGHGSYGIHDIPGISLPMKARSLALLLLLPVASLAADCRVIDPELQGTYAGGCRKSRFKISPKFGLYLIDPSGAFRYDAFVQREGVRRAMAVRRCRAGQHQPRGATPALVLRHRCRFVHRLRRRLADVVA